MSLNARKAIFSVAVLVSGPVGVLLPWAMNRSARGERFVVWGDTFAGGILAGAGLVHLLSGAANGFHAFAPGFKFPLAFALTGAGFLPVLLVEAVVMADPDPGCSPLPYRSGGSSHEIGSDVRTPTANPVAFDSASYAVDSLIHHRMALGAQNSESQALIVFIGIIAHKSMAGFALGVSYRRAGRSLRKAFPVAAFFSSMAPLGILAGATVDTLISGNGRQLF